MDVNGFKFNKLEFLRKNIDDPTDGIPTLYGIYSWVYWPDFASTTILPAALISHLIDYTSKNFYIEEELVGLYKFEGKIWEQGYKLNGNLFGLSDDKNIALSTFLTDRANINYFHSFFKELCFARPFYVGKANNLRQRLSIHFKGAKSHILPEINKKGIPENHIWVGYKEIQYSSGSPLPKNLNTIFEEILSRRVKPGLSIKPN